MQSITNGNQVSIPLGSLGFHSAGSPYLFWIQVVSFFFAISICPVAFVGIVAAHSDVDPEIAEITLEIIDQPDNFELLLRRGQLYRFNGKFNDALQDLEQVLVLAPDNRQAALERCRTLVALGRNHEAESDLGKYLKDESGASRVMALVERAHLYARTNRAALAVVDFSEALDFYPTVELYMERGRLQEKLGRLDAAAGGYREGLSHMPQANILRRELIRVKTAQGHYPEALNLIDDQLASASVKTEWYLRRAEVVAAMGQPAAVDHARALAEANRAFAKRPTALHRVARAKVYLALGQVEAAKQDLRLAVKKSPRFSEAQDLLKQLEGQ